MEKLVCLNVRFGTFLSVEFDTSGFSKLNLNMKINGGERIEKIDNFLMTTSSAVVDIV